MILPNDGESRKDFFSRGAIDPEMMTEYPDSVERTKACIDLYAKKDAFKLDVVDLPFIEIFEAGTWRGEEHTEADLDQMVENFKNGVTEPYIKIGHGDKQNIMKGEYKEFGLGYVSALKRVGVKLLASFKQVPKTIAELIDAGTLKKRSIEFYKTYKAADGKMLHNVVDSVAFFGANGHPAISTLAAIPALFKDKQITINTNEDLIVLKNEDKEAVDMDNVTVTKAEYAELVDAKNELEKSKTANAELVTFKADNETKVSDLEKELEVAKTELSTFKTDAETKEADALKAEAEAYIVEQIKAEKLLTKFKDSKVNDYIAKSVDADALILFKEEIESHSVDAGTGEMKTTEGTSDRIDLKDTAEIHKAVEAEMKANGGDFNKANEKVTGIKGS